ncbi:MAG: cytochrome P450 [Microscillaceae bacterium]|nr:cytochrome P450 [Microscillaceae bacterium]
MQKYLPPTYSQKHWLWGNVHYLVKNPLQFLEKASIEKRNEGVCWISSPLVKLAMVTKPEFAKHIMQDNNKNYHKGKIFRFLKPVLGNGLLTSEDDFWRRQRRLAQPAFHKQRLAEMVQTMVACGEELANEWLSAYQSGDKVNITREMNKVALMVVSTALFKSDVKAEIAGINESMEFLLDKIIERIRHPFKLPLWVPSPENWKEKQAIRQLEQVIYRMIEKRRKSNTHEGDLLDMLMEVQDEDTGERMSDQQLRDEVMTIFLAGHETTAVAMAYVWLLLAENPEIDARLQGHLQEVLNGKLPAFEDLKKLNFLKNIIDETMRIYPPVYAVERYALADDEIGGFHIPKGTNVIISPYAIQRDATWWDEPLRFDPDRWNTEKVQNLPRYTYFPFGGGPRLCIGEQFAMYEMLIIIAILRQKFSFSKSPDYKLRLDPLVTLRAWDDIELVISPLAPEGGNK